MSDILQIAVGTVTMRPYVFAFFVGFLFAAVPHLGWKKVAAFTVVGYLIAFASEFSSINNGFPYGWYYYVDTTRDRELWVAGVPFFDSLSYVFLTYCSYATALLVLAPVKMVQGDLVLLETGKIRRSFSALLLGALFQVFLDIIIDPVALQGSRWFLGRIYGYREVGVHFGVPISNYLGWFLVSLLLVWALQQIDLALSDQNKPAGIAAIPYRCLFGPFLYLCVLAFNIAVTLYIGERLMALTGLFIITLPLVMAAVLCINKINRYHEDELFAHLVEQPWSPAASATGPAMETSP
jgi:uncharacterized membrane protein